MLTIWIILVSGIVLIIRVVSITVLILVLLKHTQHIDDDKSMDSRYSNGNTTLLGLLIVFVVMISLFMVYSFIYLSQLVWFSLALLFLVSIVLTRLVLRVQCILSMVGNIISCVHIVIFMIRIISLTGISITIDSIDITNIISTLMIRLITMTLYCW